MRRRRTPPPAERGKHAPRGGKTAIRRIVKRGGERPGAVHIRYL